MTKHNINLLRGAAALAACAIGVAACDPAVGPSELSQMPKPGMTIVVREYGLNMYGARTSTGNLRWITVSPDTGPYKGAASVSRWVTRPDTSRTTRGDTAFVQYLSNGDIAWWQVAEDTGPIDLNGGRWVTMPIGSKGSRVTTAIDTSFTFMQTRYRMRELWTSSFRGPEMIDTGMTQSTRVPTLATLKSDVVQLVDSATNLPLRPPIEATHTFWYSPKLGMFVRMEVVLTYPAAVGSGREGGGGGYEIVSFMQR